jgi:hypothetical protein
VGGNQEGFDEDGEEVQEDKGSACKYQGWWLERRAASKASKERRGEERRARGGCIDDSTVDILLKILLRSHPSLANKTSEPCRSASLFNTPWAICLGPRIPEVYALSLAAIWSWKRGANCSTEKYMLSTFGLLHWDIHQIVMS